MRARGDTIVGAPFSGLRTRVLLLVALALVPAVAMTVYTSLEQRGAAVDAVYQGNLALARLTAAEQERLIEAARQLLVGLAQVPDVRDPTSPGCASLMADLAQEFPPYADLGVADTGGRIRCSAVPVDAAVTVADQAWFRRTLVTGSYSVGDYGLGPLTQTASIVVGYPVRDDAGAMAGVVYATLELDWMAQRAAEAGLPPGSVLVVLDAAGRVLMRVPAVDSVIGRPMPDAGLLEAVAASREGVAEVPGADNVTRLYAFARLAGPTDDAAASVAIGVPRAEAFAAADRVFARNLVTLLLVALLSFAGAWVGTEVYVLRHEETRALLAAIVESSEDAVVSKTADGVITSWNPGAARLLGYDASEVVGHPITIVVPPAWEEEERALLSRVARGETVRHFETQRRRKDGTVVEVSLSAAPIRDADARIVGISTVTRDVTQRRRAEDEIRFQKTLLEAQNEASLDGILLVGPDGRILSYNARFAEMWRIPADVLRLRSDDAALQAVLDQLKDPQEFLARVRQLYDDRTKTSRDEVVLADGRVFDRYSAPVTDAGGVHHGRLWVFRDVTDERTGARDRALLASIVESSYDAIVAESADGTILSWNRGAERMYGYTPQEAVGRHFSFLVPPERTGDVATILERVGRGERIEGFETVRMAKDGTRKHVSISQSPLLDASGHVMGSSAIARDISDRKRAERALADSQQRLERQNQAIVRMSTSTRYVSGGLDEALWAITEVAAATLDVERASVWLYDDARTLIRCVDLYEQTPKRHTSGLELGARSYPSYFRALEEEPQVSADDARTDPRTREFTDSYLGPLGITSMLDAPVWVGGRLIGVLCHEHTGPARSWTPDEQSFSRSMADLVAIAVQTHERQRVQEQLRFQKTLLESQNEASIDGILIVDRDGTVVSSNRRFVEMWGLPPGTIEAGRTDEATLGKALQRIAHVDAFLGSIGRLAADPQETLRDEVVLPDGRVFERYSAPVVSADGVHYGRGWYFRDITQRKRAEQILQAHVGELERLNRELDSFTYTASHDLAEPLRTISAFTEIVLKEHAEAMPEQGRDDLGRVLRAGRRMQRLLDDLTLVSRVGRTVAKPVRVPLGELVADAKENLASILQGTAGEVSVSSPGVALYGDRTQLLQVLQNLVKNGLRHNDDPHPVVEISAEELPDRVRVRVRDNGVGVPDRERERIFGLFSRGTAARGEGTGAGLAIVRKILERHGGRIWVEPGPAKGSVFVVELPKA